MVSVCCSVMNRTNEHEFVRVGFESIYICIMKIV